jgi:hypothetical protein
VERGWRKPDLPIFNKPQDRVILHYFQDEWPNLPISLPISRRSPGFVTERGESSLHGSGSEPRVMAALGRGARYRGLQKQDEPEGELPPGTPTLDPIRRVLGSVDVGSDLRTLSLVVSPDRDLYGDALLTLEIACQGPE